ncbi:cell division protein FtsQ/DivIB [Geobacter sp. SVR]|uniref:cell division protein FtsQ/DivIB n=1 Tax=Geobacter sp. SVR TaxID=2495594 RepID=UPI00143EF963|nr:FtsQ-type POTRA domain-containing protein [Geobacter sp. SVR]BCS52298.1 cell division protein FtsQ [Geobacter sp. SVR]GCF85043.1 cell division protein FtsQ [Geobacter sp. SVR]
MRDFSSSKYQRKKVAVNRVKVQRTPINWGKYLRPLIKVASGLAGLALACVVAVIGCRTLGKIALFRVKNIDVSTAKHLTREEILSIAGVEPGRDLLHMNLKRMGEQLTQNPWVETVRIHRYFPDGLSISITEREPVAVVNMGFIYYLDKKGIVFKVLNQGDQLNYPVVTGFTEEDMTSDPNGARKALQATCELLDVLRQKGAFLLADVSEIHYDKGFGFTLFTASGALPVKVGSGDFGAKVDRFSRIYRDLMAQRPTLHYIDLDYNDKIIVKKAQNTIPDNGGGHVSNKKG